MHIFNYLCILSWPCRVKEHWIFLHFTAGCITWIYWYKRFTNLLYFSPYTVTRSIIYSSACFYKIDVINLNSSDLIANGFHTTQNFEIIEIEKKSKESKKEFLQIIDLNKGQLHKKDLRGINITSNCFTYDSWFLYFTQISSKMWKVIYVFGLLLINFFNTLPTVCVCVCVSLRVHECVRACACVCASNWQRMRLVYIFYTL